MIILRDEEIDRPPLEADSGTVTFIIPEVPLVSETQVNSEDIKKYINDSIKAAVEISNVDKLIDNFIKLLPREINVNTDKFEKEMEKIMERFDELIEKLTKEAIINNIESIKKESIFEKIKKYIGL